MSSATKPDPRHNRHIPQALLVLGIVLVAFNLRPAIAGFPPLLAQMQQELAVPSSVLSLLTTIPVLCFGLMAPVAPLLTRWRSTESVIELALIVTTLGAALRIGPSLGWIMAGTVLLGVGIALLNVLLPGLVKRDFPTKTGLMTGVYTMALCGGATLASALAVPLRDAAAGAWRPSLAAWALLALVGALAWLPALWARQHHAVADASHVGSLWKDAVAWQVTLFMGLQSLTFFAWLTWMPSFLQAHGYSVAASGNLLAIANFVQIPVTLIIPILATRLPRQRALAVSVCVLSGVAVLGLLLAPTRAVLLWVVLLGGAAGAQVALALTWVVLRARDNHQVAHLSAMSQGIGYLLAAGGPVAFGWLHDLTHAWDASWLLVLACFAVMGFCGLGAGRAIYVGGGRLPVLPRDARELAWASVGAEIEQEE